MSIESEWLCPPGRLRHYEQKTGYAYGINKAAKLASALSLPGITVIEVGVAGGRGLLKMEEYAERYAARYTLPIDVVGLDLGEGLEAGFGYKDLPHYFRQGSYPMDEAALRARLAPTTELIIGDATRTIAPVMRQARYHVGFVSLDMDQYTPTQIVLDILGVESNFLPRTPIWFDDVVGTGGQDYCPWTGELLAIEQFNLKSHVVKICEDRYFRALPVNEAWHHSCYVMHRFRHPFYNTWIRPELSYELSL